MNATSRWATTARMLDRMTSDDVLSRPAIIATLTFGVALHLYGNTSAISGSVALRMVIALAAGGAMFIALAAMWVVVRRFSGATRVVLAFAAYAVAGAIRGVVLQLLLSVTGMQPFTAPLLMERVFSGTVLMSLTLAAAAYVISLYRELRDQHLVLALEMERLTAAISESSEITRQQQTEAVERVQSILEQQIAQLPLDEADRTMQSLSSVIGDVVRPMSHELARSVPVWQLPDISATRVTWPGILSKLRLEGALRPVFVTVVLAVMGIPSAAPIYGLRTAAVLYAFGLVTTPVGIILVRQLLSPVVNRMPPIARVAGITVALLIAAMPTLYVFVRVLDGVESGHTYQIALLVQMPMTGWLAALATAARADLDAVNGRLIDINEQLRWIVTRSRMMQWHQQRQLSRALHGPVQSALHASIRRMQHAIDADTATTDFTRDLRDDLQRTVVGLLTQHDNPIDAQRELDELTEAWDGIASIIVDAAPSVLPRINDDQACATAVGDIAQEAVSNAIRHGNANRVLIEIRDVAEDRIELAVIDNGVSRADREQAGLGTEQLDDCALVWTRERQLDGTHLHAVLPIAASGARIPS